MTQQDDGYVLETLPIATEPFGHVNMLKFSFSQRTSRAHRIANWLKFPISIALIAFVVSRLQQSCIDLWNLEYETILQLPHSTIAQVFAATLLALVLLLRRERRDTLLVMENIGLQLTQQRPWRFISNSDRFIPVNQLLDIVIHEGFHGYGQVIFYLCVITRPKTSENSSSNNSNNIALVFPQILPRRDALVPIWRQSRQLLFASKGWFPSSTENCKINGF